jgi:hypothetical protein
MKHSAIVTKWLEHDATWREYHTPSAMIAYYMSIGYYERMKDERLTQEQRDNAGWNWLTSLQWLERCIRNVQ